MYLLPDWIKENAESSRLVSSLKNETLNAWTCSSWIINDSNIIAAVNVPVLKTHMPYLFYPACPCYSGVEDWFIIAFC